MKIGACRVFTFSEDVIKAGAEIKSSHLRIKGKGIDVPVIRVGSEFVRVATTLSNQGKMLVSAKIKKTKNGEEFVPDDVETDEFVIVVFETEPNKSSNEYTGDRAGWICQARHCGFFCNDASKHPPEQCPKCGAGYDWYPAVQFNEPCPCFVYKDFPGEIIQNDGCGGIIAMIPKNATFRVIPRGSGNGHYYTWDGKMFIHQIKWGAG